MPRLADAYASYRQLSYQRMVGCVQTVTIAISFARGSQAFCAERRLPSEVRGPVECCALARLAMSCLSEIGLSGGDMKKILPISGVARAWDGV